MEAHILHPMTPARPVLYYPPLAFWRATAVTLLLSRILWEYLALGVGFLVFPCMGNPCGKSGHASDALDCSFMKSPDYINGFANRNSLKDAPPGPRNYGRCPRHICIISVVRSLCQPN